MLEKRPRRKAVDGLRVYFTLWVALCHMYFLEEGTGEISKLHLAIIKNGSISVSFFFLLSGFVIGYNYLDQFRHLDLKDCLLFWKKRLLSFYGLYVATNLYAALYCILVEHNEIIKVLQKFILLVCMLQSPTTIEFGELNSPTWYLSCIFWIYLLTPIILNVVYRLNKKKIVLLGIFCYLIIWVNAFIFICMQHFNFVEFRTLFRLCYGSPYIRIWYYILGIVVSCLYINRIEFSKRKHIIQDKNTVLEAFSVIILFAVYFGVQKNLDIYVIGNIFYVPVLILIIWIFLQENGKVSALLKNRIHQHLASISEYFFLIHFLVINYGGNQLLSKIVTGTNSVALLTKEILLLFVSYLLAEIWYFIHKIPYF